MWECPPPPPGHIPEAHFSKVLRALDLDTSSVPPSPITKGRLGPLELHTVFHRGWLASFLVRGELHQLSCSRVLSP